MTPTTKKVIACTAISIFAVSLLPCFAAANECTEPTIQKLSRSDTTIVSATFRSDPAPNCDVLGYVTTLNPGPNQVNFELTLPIRNNGRFLFIGNGGMAGSLSFPEVFHDFEDLSSLTTSGYAIAFTDTGHQGSFLDGSWALFDQAKQDDYLFRGVHVAAVATKAIITKFYGQQPRSYFAGCSDGGREGLVEAQHYPDDFDGIVAGDPALGEFVAGFNWNQEHLTAASANFLTEDKLALVDSKILKSCDATDGVTDGLIQDPRKCTFNPNTLLCSYSGQPDCLTASEIGSLATVYEGARKANGQLVYSGFSKSNSSAGGGWAAWITGFAAPDAPGSAQPWSDPAAASWQFIFQDQALKYFVFGDPQYHSLRFRIDSADLAKLHSVWNYEGGEATNPDLSAFQRRGGKLIIYHGWSDPATSPVETIRYYQNVQQQSGRVATEAFARLFMVPGMEHCIATGSGPNIFDPLPAVTNWVESGSPPDRILAKQLDSVTQEISRTMPLCPYPRAASFLGGSTKKASNWTCH